MPKKRLIPSALAAVLILALFGFVLARVRAHRPVLAGIVATEPTVRVASPLDVAETIYDGKFTGNWEDWGWGPHESPKTAGPLKIVFSGYGGIVLHHAELRASFGGLSFRYQAPASFPDAFLAVTLKRSGGDTDSFPQVVVEPKYIATLSDDWKEVLIPWAELDPHNLPVDRVTIVGQRAVGPDWVQLDKIVLTKGGAGPAASATVSSQGVELTVQCGGKTHAISPLIYGASNGDWASGQTAQRIGGNAMTRLNWDLGNTWNTGNDWFFENVKGDMGLSQWIDAGVTQKVQTALVVPMIGWVAKDATSSGFPKSKFPGQRKYDQNRPEAGDGFLPSGAKIQPGPATQTSIPAPPELIGKWIRMLRAKDAARGSRGVNMYLLDNEPALWNSNHRDVHPEALTYDELLDRTLRYAGAIRDADPDGAIAGPTEWGWTNYFYSAKDSEVGVQQHPDRAAHGGVALIPWYLKKLADYEKANNKRLLDVLDVHFYPAADGLYGSNARTDDEGAALRLRATRALWDPGYRDESWINEPVSLIPRLKTWVAENYPGLKVSLGEWSFGADNHISGALATAEALGRFGQQGLDAAFYWDGPKAGSKTFWAFRAFRNFDGKGARFLDVSLPTRETEMVSLFASRNAAGDHIVAILVNRDPRVTAEAHVRLEGCGEAGSHRTFIYGSSAKALVALPAGVDPDSDGASVTTTLSPFSITVLDIPMKPAHGAGEAK
jgi:hypothetical protein